MVYIYLYLWLEFTVNVGKYTIHGSYGKNTFPFGFPNLSHPGFGDAGADRYYGAPVIRDTVVGYIQFFFGRFMVWMYGPYMFLYCLI